MLNKRRSATLDEIHFREMQLDRTAYLRRQSLTKAEPASSILAGRFGSMQSVRMWWWRQNFYPVLRMTSEPGLQGSSILSG